MPEEKYYIATDNSPEDLAEEVNRLMREGWQPQGGLSTVVTYVGEPEFFQAMVKP